MENDKYAQMILVNGQVVTMDDAETVAQAVAVKDGRIWMVGADDKIKQTCGSHTEKIDLKGKTVLPGFIEAHTHVDLTGMMTSDLVVNCRIPPLKNNEEVLKRLKEKVQNTPKGQLILAHGRWVQPNLKKEQLDEIAPEHPVILKYGMHLYLLNSFALKKHGISTDRPTPEEFFEKAPGAQIQRNPLTGEPIGFLGDAWDFLYPGSPSPLSYQDTKAGIINGLNTYVRAGVTSITEFVDYKESVQIYHDLRRNNQLPARLQMVICVHGLHKTTNLDALLQAGLTTGFGDEWISFGGAKIFVDLGVETTLTSIQLKEMVMRAHQAGIRVYMHANTRMAQDMALAAVEAAAERMPQIKLRHRLEHMGNRLIDLNYFDRVKNADAIALPTAYFMNVGRSFQEGQELFLFRTMLDKRLCVPGNSDTGGTEPQAPNPLYQVWCMAARKDREGRDVYPEERLTVEEGLRLYTRHSAFGALQEDTKGSIEPGKLADFVVLEKDPLRCPLDEVCDIKVDKTIVGGTIVFQAN